MINKMTVGQVLAWSAKHRELKGEGVRVAHVKSLIAQESKELGKKIDKLEDFILSLPKYKNE